MNIGEFLLFTGIVMGFASIALLLRREEEKARWSIALFAVSLTLAFFLLVYYFATSNLSINYVWSYTSRDLPLFYKLSGTLAGQQGTLLFWAFLISIGSLWLNERNPFSDFIRDAQIIILSLGLYFTALTLLDSPFQTIYAVNPGLDVSFVPVDGSGLNPLLIDPWMAVHPPLMFIAYGVMAVPFAVALVYLFTSNYKPWIANVLQWCRISWIFLTLGIAVGGFWSYKVLGWGGFWAWDPVETSSLVPWLILTGALHALAEHRNNKEKYSILAPALVALSFVLVLYATLVTRSGFFESIHAFGSGEVGTYLVSLIAICALSSIFLALRRYMGSEEREEEPSVVNRTNIFYGAILLFIILTFVSFWGITFPAIYKLATGNKVGVGVAFFNLWSYPFFIAAMLLLGLGLNFRQSEKEEKLKEFALFFALTIVFALIKPSEDWNIVDYSSIVTPEKPPLYTLIGSMSSLSFIPPSVYILYSLLGRGRDRLRIKGQRKLKEAGVLVIHLGVVLILLGAVFSTLFTRELSTSLDAADKVVRIGGTQYAVKLADYREYSEYSKEKIELPGISLSEFYSSNLSHSEVYLVRGRVEQVLQFGNIDLLRLADGGKSLWVATNVINIPEGMEIAASGVLIFNRSIDAESFDILMISSEIYPENRIVSTTQEVSIEVYEGNDRIASGVAKVVQYKQSDVKRVMIDRGIFRDIYIIFTGISGSEIPLTVKIIPLVNYLWLGVVLFALGMLAILLSRMEK